MEKIIRFIIGLLFILVTAFLDEKTGRKHGYMVGYLTALFISGVIMNN